LFTPAECVAIIDVKLLNLNQAFAECKVTQGCDLLIVTKCGVKSFKSAKERHADDGRIERVVLEGRCHGRIRYAANPWRNARFREVNSPGLDGSAQFILLISFFITTIRSILSSILDYGSASVRGSVTFKNCKTVLIHQLTETLLQLECLSHAPATRLSPI
jgi:hypothetical protein